MKIKSKVFKEGEPIPKEYTYDGEDVSPPLSFYNVPKNAEYLCLVCEDVDAPSKKPWVHWKIIFDGNLRKIGADFSRRESSQKKILHQYRNSWGNPYYQGPKPPKGKGAHRYYFTLTAIDKSKILIVGVSAVLMGTYERT